jgi:hypothetical protein
MSTFDPNDPMNAMMMKMLGTKPSNEVAPEQLAAVPTKGPPINDYLFPEPLKPPGNSHGPGIIEGPHDSDEGSWIDQTLGLDPTKSFMDSWVNGILGPAKVKDGDSQGTIALRALYGAAMAPVLGYAVPAADLMDTLAYGPWSATEHQTVEHAKEAKEAHEKQMEEMQHAKPWQPEEEIQKIALGGH